MSRYNEIFLGLDPVRATRLSVLSTLGLTVHHLIELLLAPASLLSALEFLLL